MKRILYLLLFAITTCGSTGYAQSKKSNEAEKRRLREQIAEYEQKLSQMENAPKSQQTRQRDLSDNEVEALFSEELKKIFTKNPQLETKIYNLTRAIYAGKATSADYISLFDQIPDMPSKVIVYNELHSELKGELATQKNIYRTKDREMQRIVSNFQQEIYQKTKIYPKNLDGETIAKRPIDAGAHNFINKINAEREEMQMSRLDDETVNYLKKRRDAASMEYLEADVAKSESARKLNRLKKGLEELQKACPECANQ